MPISPLLPIAGVAIGSLAIRVVQQLPDPASFANLLRNVAGTPATEDQIATADESSSDVSVDRMSNAFAIAPSSGTQDSLDDFQRLLMRKLATAGIDTAHPIQLQSDGLGGVIVSNDHPERVAIEQLFLDEPDLTEMFNQLLDVGEFRLVVCGATVELQYGSERA